MGHNDYVRPNAIYTDAFSLVTSDLRTLDALTTKSINGDDGGTWNPTGPICVGGAGLLLTANAAFFTGAETRSGGRIVHNDSDYFNFNDPDTASLVRGRSVLAPVCNSLGGARDANDGEFFNPWPNVLPDGRVFWTTATQAAVGPTSSHSIQVCLDPWIHDGAHLMGAVLTFKVNDIPTNVVTNQINCGVVSILDDGTTSVVLAGALTPASPIAFYHQTKVQTLNLALAFADGTNNIIDRSTKNYLLRIDYSEGAGSPANAVFLTLKMDFEQIADMRFQ